MRFQVKKNPILVCLTLGLLLIIISVLITSFILGEGILICTIIFVFVTPIIIALVWALFHSYHELKDDELLAIFGFIKIHIPFNEITEIRFSSSPMSSPAWTFRRIKIDFKRYDFILLSLPKNEKSFLQEMKKRCPSADIRNNQGELISLKISQEDR